MQFTRALGLLASLAAFAAAQSTEGASSTASTTDASSTASDASSSASAASVSSTASAVASSSITSVAATSSAASVADASSTASSSASGSVSQVTVVVAGSVNPTRTTLTSDVVYTSVISQSVFSTNSKKIGYITSTVNIQPYTTTGTSTAGVYTAHGIGQPFTAKTDSGAMPTAAAKLALGGMAGAALGVAALL